MLEESFGLMQRLLVSYMTLLHRLTDYETVRAQFGAEVF